MPTAVSFGNCEWQEAPGPAEGASGYFAEVIKSGKGSLAHALTVRAHAFSAGARDAITAAGGAVEVVGA